ETVLRRPATAFNKEISMRSKLFIFMTAVCALTFLVGNAWAQRCFEQPPPGTDQFQSAAELLIDTTFSGYPDISVDVRGPFVVNRGAPVRPLDGRCEIPTQMTALTLTGSSPTLGPITVSLGAQPSRGLIKQITPGMDFPASSFFDVFVTIELQFGGETMKLENRDPITMT